MNSLTRNFRQALIPAIITAVLLLIPLVAMQFTEEVVWTLSDFIIAGSLLFGTGLTYSVLRSKYDGTGLRWSSISCRITADMDELGSGHYWVRKLTN